MSEHAEGTFRPVETRAGKKRSLVHQPRVRLGAVVAVAVAGGLIAWAATSGHGKSTTSAGSGPAGPVQSTGPVALSENGLRALVKVLDQPVYWAGPKAGYTYELTRTSNRNVYVRYLSPGVKAGDKRAVFLIVATYPFKNAYAVLKRLAHGNGVSLPGGGLAVVQDNYPKSVHVAFPGVDYQIEVFDQSPAVAKQTALSGSIAPVR